MKKLILITALITLLIIITALMQGNTEIKYSVNKTGSREREITIQTLNNTKVYYEQLSQEFMYNVGEYWDKGARTAGSNTAGIYLDWLWGKLEPEKGIYDWTSLTDTGMLNKNGELTTDAEHVFIRLGVIATSAWIVGEGMDSFQETGYPSWIDKHNLTQVKQEYPKFIKALINHLKFKPDFYMIEVEVNALGINAGLTNEEVINWLGNLTSTIKEADETAKVSITVTSGDLSPFMVNDTRILPVTEFLNRTKQINYDIITTFIQPFGWVSKGDWHDAARFIDSLCQFNKSIYIAWAGFLAEKPLAPEGFTYYPANYSEEWQAEQTLKLMNYTINNPKVIGIHWDMLDYVETGTGGKNVNVKLTTGFTAGYREGDNVIKGRERPVYNIMINYWMGLFTKGENITDSNGILRFRGLSGRYKINVNNKEEIINIK